MRIIIDQHFWLQRSGRILLAILLAVMAAYISWGARRQTPITVAPMHQVQKLAAGANVSIHSNATANPATEPATASSVVTDTVGSTAALSGSTQAAPPASTATPVDSPAYQVTAPAGDDSQPAGNESALSNITFPAKPLPKADPLPIPNPYPYPPVYHGCYPPGPPGTMHPDYCIVMDD